jgi:hypothetical protein
MAINIPVVYEEGNLLTGSTTIIVSKIPQWAPQLSPFSYSGRIGFESKPMAGYS